MRITWEVRPFFFFVEVNKHRETNHYLTNIGSTLSKPCPRKKTEVDSMATTALLKRHWDKLRSDDADTSDCCPYLQKLQAIVNASSNKSAPPLDKDIRPAAAVEAHIIHVEDEDLDEADKFLHLAAHVIHTSPKALEESRVAIPSFFGERDLGGDALLLLQRYYLFFY